MRLGVFGLDLFHSEATAVAFSCDNDKIYVLLKYETRTHFRYSVAKIYDNEGPKI